MEITHLPLKDIILDPKLQMRARIDMAYIDELAEAIFDLPPVQVVRGPAGELWLWDGWHRHGAFVKATQLTIPCHVTDGTWDDAEAAAAGANQTHGMRRTVEDKRRTVRALIAAHKDWSDRQIAKVANVTHPFVAKLTHDMSTPYVKNEKVVTLPPQVCKSCERKKRVGIPLPKKCPDCKLLNQAVPDAADEAPEAPVPYCVRCLELGYRVTDCQKCAGIEGGPEPEPEAPVEDDGGTAIPVRLLPVFAARADFDKAMRLLTSCATAFSAIERGAAKHLKPKDAKHYVRYYPVFRQARLMLKAVRPALVCPACGGDACDKCQDGVLTAEAANV